MQIFHKQMESLLLAGNRNISVVIFPLWGKGNAFPFPLLESLSSSRTRGYATNSLPFWVRELAAMPWILDFFPFLNLTLQETLEKKSLPGETMTVSTIHPTLHPTVGRYYDFCITCVPKKYLSNHSTTKKVTMKSSSVFN